MRNWPRVLAMLISTVLPISLLSKLTSTTSTVSIPHFTSKVDRGSIFDRNGVGLAITRTVPSVYADPKYVSDPKSTTILLGKMLPDLDEQTLILKLASRKRFVWVSRNVNESTSKEIIKQNIPGIGIKRESYRTYPEGIKTALTGYTSLGTNTGMTGVEMQFNQELTRGKPVQLSIDIKVQAVLYEELVNAMHSYHAKGAAGVVLDAATSEVLGMVSLPEVDPNNHKYINFDKPGYTNKLISDVYEMGGIFEIFSTAQAIEENKVTVDQLIDVSTPVYVGAKIISGDSKNHGEMTVADIFAQASLVGAAHISQQLKPMQQKEFLSRLGLLEPIRIEVGESIGKPLYPHQTWDNLGRTTIGYGYGIAVTPLQAAVAATAIVNQGKLIPPTLVKNTSGGARHGKQVITKATSRQLCAMMRRVVTQGTGKLADVPGYYVGGKTGASLKLKDGQYNQSHQMVWFFAGFPMKDSPRYTMLLMLDEPDSAAGTDNKSGTQWNIAPTAGRIIERIVPILNVDTLG